MEKVTNPQVKILASGNSFTAKLMQANAGKLLREHLASTESILVIQEGECVFNMNGKDLTLKQGEAIVVPSETKHQIKAIKDFKAIHFMPKNIKFQFFG